MYNYKYKTFYTKDPIKDKYGTTKEEIYSLIFEILIDPSSKCLTIIFLSYFCTNYNTQHYGK